MQVIATITGTRKLLAHQDNIQWGEIVKAWQMNPNNKDLQVKGDDRSPAFSWLGSLYHDDEVVAIPTEVIMAMLRVGGAQVIMAGRKSFKAATQSGIIPLDAYWPLTSDGKTISVKPLLELASETNFDRHLAVVQQLGFDLLVKRARVGTAKHVRVRPLFNRWAIEGVLEITDPMITVEALQTILSYAGRYCGLGDWRPGSKSPGSYGTFTATVTEV